MRTIFRLIGFFIVITSPLAAYSQGDVPDNVLDIFYDSCALVGCHAGPNSQKELDLTEEFIVPSLVNQPSKQRAGIMRVKPGDPTNSYLVMKLKAAPGIEGDQMPRGRNALSPEQIAAIENWIRSLPAGMKAEAPQREYAQAFPGLTVATLPTTETLEKGTFSYRIAHRWDGAVKEGFDELFGLDFGARMLTQLAFPVTNNIMVHIARSGENATFEFAGKWRFMREKTDGSVPFSAALAAGLDWETRKEIPGVSTSRTNSERFHWFVQIPLSRQLGSRISVLVVPGVLINGNAALADEDPIVTIGFAGKVMLFKDFSIFVEGVPIVAGADGAATVGGTRNQSGELVFNDAFTVGFERKVGGHVFHMYITNSLGLSTNQYMSGGNFDFLDGDFRLGFNIYRILRLPF